MSIALEDQARLVLSENDFLDRVTAACFQGAVSALNAAPNPDATIQAKRLAMAHEIVNDARKYRTTWAWVIVTRPSLNDTSGLTDTFLITQLNSLSLFDIVAQQVVHDAVVTP